MPGAVRRISGPRRMTAELAEPGGTMDKSWGHRTRPPAQTVAWLRPMLARMGITRLADVTGLDRLGIPVAQAIRPMGRSLSVAQGKGISLDAAYASAAMEAVETWHAEFIDQPQIHCPPQALSGLEQESGLGSGLGSGPVGVPQVAALPAWDLLQERTALVALSAVSMDFTRPEDLPGVVRSSNGLAGGNNRDEALASALHELIERDCTADFLAQPAALRRLRRIDPAMLHRMSPALDWLCARIKAADMCLDLFDMRNDLDVPAVRAVLYERNGTGRAAAFGHGAHLDPATALVRAITEAAQARVTAIAGSRDDLPPNTAQGNPLETLSRQLERAADLATGARGVFCARDRSGVRAAQDVSALIARLDRAGLREVLAVDLTREDIGVPVFRVIVPGLGRVAPAGATIGLRHRRSV